MKMVRNIKKFEIGNDVLVHIMIDEKEHQEGKISDLEGSLMTVDFGAASMKFSAQDSRIQKMPGHYSRAMEYLEIYTR